MVDVVKTRDAESGRESFAISGFMLPAEGGYLGHYSDTNAGSIRPNLVLYGLTYAVYLVNFVAHLLNVSLPHRLSNKLDASFVLTHDPVVN